ncbi:hypothetical protein JW979_09245 [bacterium]|nr:hypothetical protein [candidate division CSSED10-310 bacterium]
MAIEENRKKRVAYKFSMGLLILWIVFALYVRINKMAGAMPYPGNMDEPFLANRAVQILKTGNFNPKFFKYPSLPIYVTASGFSLGFINSASHLELKTVDDISSVGFPYYKPARVIWPAKLIFAVCSVLAVIFMALTAFRIFNLPSLLFLVPIVVSLSEEYFKYSQQYINVDILGAFFISAVYFQLFRDNKPESYWSNVVFPGILSGMAAGCKYNLLWVIVSVMLATVLLGRGNRIGKCFVVLASAIVGFVLVVPYSILDLRTFMNQIADEARHYQQGHTGYEAEPGIQQLIFYLNELRNDIGWVVAGLVLMGLFYAFWKNYKKTLVLVSFPLILIGFMSMQKVHFIRNIISVYLFIGVFAGLGIILLMQLFLELKFMKFLSSRSRLMNPRVISICGIILLFLLTVPLNRAIQRLMVPEDTRNIAVDYIQRNIPPSSIIIVPEELNMNVEPLKKPYRIHLMPFKSMTLEQFQTALLEYPDPYVLMPEFDYDHRHKDGKEISDRLNTFSSILNPINVFNGEPVLVNYFQTVPNGNPAFRISIPK